MISIASKSTERLLDAGQSRTFTEYKQRTMTPSNPLLVGIQEQYLSYETKCAILNGIWGTNYTTQELVAQRLGESYLHYYDEQCRNVLHSPKLETFIRTHNDIIEIVHHLQEHPTRLREDINLQLVSALAKSEPDAAEDCLDEGIDLAARLLSMTAIGKLKHSFIPGQKPLIWESGPLKALLEGRFQIPASTNKSIIRVKLGRLFIARNLERIAGLKIVWTDNLSDHLRLMRDDTEVAIYHHASFLEHQKKSPIFPDGFIDETLQTFCLLLLSSTGHLGSGSELSRPNSG